MWCAALLVWCAALLVWCAALLVWRAALLVWCGALLVWCAAKPYIGIGIKKFAILYLGSGQKKLALWSKTLYRNLMFLMKKRIHLVSGR